MLMRVRFAYDGNHGGYEALDKNSNYLYPSAGHVITCYLNDLPDARVHNIISKGPK